MEYYLFLDESGDHGLKTIDHNFPLFLLCGILISEKNYTIVKNELNAIKNYFWNNRNVIFHSRDIRKCNNEFQIFFDLHLKEEFYKRINSLVGKDLYRIISAAIDKKKYVRKYGKLKDDVYEISLSFIVERAVFCLDSFGDCDQLDIYIEKRGKKEDLQLARHIQKLSQVGTYFLDFSRIRDYGFRPYFKWKSENINGLQLSDLIAYPTARYVLNPKGVNLSFDQFKHNFYSQRGEIYGLKVFP